MLLTRREANRENREELFSFGLPIRNRSFLSYLRLLRSRQSYPALYHNERCLSHVNIPNIQPFGDPASIWFYFQNSSFSENSSQSTGRVVPWLTKLLNQIYHNHKLWERTMMLLHSQNRPILHTPVGAKNNRNYHFSAQYPNCLCHNNHVFCFQISFQPIFELDCNGFTSFLVTPLHYMSKRTSSDNFIKWSKLVVKCRKVFQFSRIHFVKILIYSTNSAWNVNWTTNCSLRNETIMQFVSRFYTCRISLVLRVQC